MKIKTFILSILVGYLLVTSAWAEHEANHRYNIRGYILDSNQQGISGLAIQVFSGTQILGASTTDSDGYYSLHLHLHNVDRGRTLLLRAGKHKAELRVTFDATDQTTARVHEANFVDGTFTESRLSRFRIPSWVYPLGGFILLGVIVVALETRRKKKIRQKMKASHANQQATKHKAKKGRRKKH
ncbi:MAG: carboxypeptidase regulatory-like domain-containing protein [Proteobacteria bacterium]|nr:carboxypeptidase regulatory-like domain-containing protein [Pseudomonadota bacterium]